MVKKEVNKRKKPIFKFSKAMRKKLMVLFTCITLLLCALIGRLMYINYTSGEKYKEKVLKWKEKAEEFYLLKKNAKNGIGLKEFIYREKKEFEQSNRYKEMKIGDRYFANDSDIQNKLRKYVDLDGTEKIARHAKNFKLEHSIIYKLVMQKASYLLKQEPTIQQRDDEHKNEQYTKELSKIFNKRMHKRLKRTVIEVVNKGINWWYVYIDETGDLKVQLKYATKIIPLWADDEHEVLDGIIMVYKLEQYTDTGKEDVIKIAVYFIGKCIKDDIVCQESELLEAMFVPIETALELLSFDDTKRVLKEADDYISSLSNCSK